MKFRFFKAKTRNYWKTLEPKSFFALEALGTKLIVKNCKLSFSLKPLQTVNPNLLSSLKILFLLLLKKYMKNVKKGKPGIM